MYKLYKSFMESILGKEEYKDQPQIIVSNSVKDIVSSNDVIDTIEEPKTTFDLLLSDSYDLYLTRVEHAIRDTKRVEIKNYIIVFEAVTNDDGHEHIVKDILIFYIKDGEKHIDYKNLKYKIYSEYDANIKNFSELYFERMIKGGVFNKYGYVSMNNANYNLTENNNIDCLYNEINTLLAKW